jgi:tetratricopeptide (TPR) repeat protein
MRRFAQSRLLLSKTCSARPEPLDLKKAVSAAFGSAREAFLGILILYLSVSTDVSREIQHGCTRSFNGTRSMDEIHDHNLSYGRFYNSNSSVYEFLPVDSMPVHRYIQSNPPSFETFICAIGNLRILFWAASTTHLFLAVAELWFLLRFVCPSAGAILLHCTGLIVLSTFLYWVLFDERISRNPIASNYRHPIPCSLFTTTVLLYWNIVFLGNTILSWGVRNLRLCVRNLSMGVWGLAALARAAWGRRRRAGPRPTSLNDSNAVPATIKYGEKYLAFDSIPRNAQCGDLIPFLELRLGSKVPRNARLMVNGRFLKMHETVDEAGLIGHSTIEVSVPIRGGMNCFKSCFRPNLPSDSESSRLRAMDGAPGAASAPAQASPTSPPQAPRHGQHLESGPADQSAVPNFEKSTPPVTKQGHGQHFESGPADQSAVPNFEKSTPPPVTKQGCEFWSIPVGNLRSLIRDLEKDIQAWISQKAPKYNDDTGPSVELNGKSYPFAEYFRQMKIDPKRDVRYSKYYSNQRHTIAGSYVWADSNLTEFADELEKPVHSEKFCWIDVLINCQYEIENSGQVVGLTGEVYSNCDVLILLSASIFTRAWCLLEAANYTRNGCKLHVVGRCSFLQGEDYFSAMKAGVESDVGLIKDEIARKFGSGFHAKFNSSIDDAVVQVYGESLLYNGCYLQAVPVFEKELELKTRRGDDEESIASTYVQLGRVFHALGDYPKALHYHDEALKSQVRRFGTGHSIVANIQNNIAVALEAQGRLEEALELYQKSLETMIRAVGPDHESVAATEDNIGIVLMRKGDYENALIRHQKALDIRVKCLGHGHASVATTEMNIGNVLSAQGDYENALVHLQKALDINIKCVGPHHASVAMTKGNMAYVCKARGDLDQARVLFEEVHNIFLQCFGPGHPNTMQAARDLARCGF